ncbi:MAG: alkaline phosphatase family protein [Pseudomonadales bacterium]|jgi:arylsulfatase A-like enzyme
MKNVLFITADQWRGECLSTLGHKVQTPNLDMLASEGILFENHYANAVPCGPSRACIHTGMYLQNHRSGTNGTPLDARHTNWALEMRTHGYDPVLFGYTDTANDPRQFDADDDILKSYEGPLPGINSKIYMGTYPDAWADWLKQRGHEIPDNTYELYTKRKDVPEYENGGDVPAPLAIKANEHDTWFMVDQTMDYIEEHIKGGSNDQADNSWAVHLSLLRPHPPWIAPEPYNSMYPPSELEDILRHPDVSTEAAEHPFMAHCLSSRYSRAPEDIKKLTRLKASYYGLMTEVDHNLGRLFAFLKASGQWQNTLIIFTSDHGEQIGDHWLLGKMGYFNASYHIPLIIYDPSAKADKTRGRRLSSFTENIDIMPTMLDYLDIPIPVQCDGMSLLSSVQSGHFPANWRTEAHWEYDFRDVPKGEVLEQQLELTQDQCTLNVIRDGHYKYVHFTALPPLFFDLKNDPNEMVNLANDPKYAQKVLAYSQKMLSWRMNHDEQTLTHLALTDTGVISRPDARY